MKQTKYTILFQSGKEKEVIAFGRKNAIILGMAWAIQEGLDYSIKEISDENGNIFKDIEFYIKIS